MAGIGGLAGIEDGTDCTPGGFNPEGGVSGARPPGGGGMGEPDTGGTAPGIGGIGDLSGERGAGAALGGVTASPELPSAVEEAEGGVAAGTGFGGNLSGGSFTGPTEGVGNGELGGESLTLKNGSEN